MDYAAALIEQNHMLGELLRDADQMTCIGCSAVRPWRPPGNRAHTGPVGSQDPATSPDLASMRLIAV
jgi:hypothetical protein